MIVKLLPCQNRSLKTLENFEKPKEGSYRFSRKKFTEFGFSLTIYMLKYTTVSDFPKKHRFFPDQNDIVGATYQDYSHQSFVMHSLEKKFLMTKTHFIECTYY